MIIMVTMSNERKDVRETTDRKEDVRERVEDFGGPRLKLAVRGQIPGYHMYWEVDEDAAIETLLYEGFRFVEPEEVQMKSHIVQDADVSNRVSRFSGRKADGTPQRQYLLACPDDIWAAREAHRYVQADAWDTAIRQSVDRPAPGRYNPKGVTTTLDTKYKKEF